ncbi:nucleotidyltransferase domain-containing protein [Phormidium yuhuli AB48]|uniref:Nucleotidyltransferase domain-containing protein n=1 Tax=Phormidium yuhuli AB48 TaxID=2940671 RepID=A0ABY5AQB9_9CYAN|nr:nucleotidyltransferase domain-containing protein [Phormidium yuhuli]USR91408.1 nucleotidyltransferase domain-containing protein [Phormidium yuhuli AB48]
MKTPLNIVLDQIYQGLKNIYNQQLDQVVLYGSQARGDAEPDSDIDILIVLRQEFSYSKESNKISKLIANLSLEHDTLISCALATRRQLEDYNNSFFRNVRRDGIRL